jgi:hypothetical protein
LPSHSPRAAPTRSSTSACRLRSEDKFQTRCGGCDSLPPAPQPISTSFAGANRLEEPMRIVHRTIGLCFTGVLCLALAAPASASAQSGPLADILAQLEAIAAQLAQLDALSAQLGEVSAAVHDAYVPFKVEIPGGMCDSGAFGTSNPEIAIDSDGTGTFLVSSILVKRGFMNPVDFTFFSLNTVTIDGTLFDTRTGNLFDPIGGQFGVLQSADILGMPVRRSDLGTEEFGGVVPHQIVANGDGGIDVRARFFCRSDSQDMTLATIVVAGWKKPSDTVIVTYVPGN